MITKLTKEQEKGIIEWRDHCLKIGRDTSPINKELTEKSWKKFYKILGKKEPRFWYCQSPMQANIVINILEKFDGEGGARIRDNIQKNIVNNIKDNIRNNIRKNIRDNIGKNIGKNIWMNVWENIYENIRNNIKSNIRNKIKDNIHKNVKENIVENVLENIWRNVNHNIKLNIKDNIEKNIGVNIQNNIKDNIRENIWENIWVSIGENIEANILNSIENICKSKLKKIQTYSFCQHDISWIAYYKYFEKYGLLQKDKDFEIIDIWYDLACSCGWCYTFENIVFVCEKPSEIHLNDNGQLHNDGDIALKYSDGYGLYMLNGIKVPKYLAITPESELDIKFFKEEKNADVRAEFIRKYGINRMKSLGKKIDSWENYKTNEWWVKSEYELIDMANIFESIDYAPHINMRNMTTGIYHLEGVSPECKTLEQAMNWREQIKKEKYKTLSIK